MGCALNRKSRWIRSIPKLLLLTHTRALVRRFSDSLPNVSIDLLEHRPRWARNIRHPGLMKPLTRRYLGGGAIIRNIGRPTCRLGLNASESIRRPCPDLCLQLIQISLFGP